MSATTPTTDDVCCVDVVISLSSLERMFATDVISECLIFARRIVVVVGDRLFTGEEEDTAWIDGLKRSFVHRTAASSRVSFLCQSVPEPGSEFDPVTAVYLHNNARAIGFRRLCELCDDQHGKAAAWWVMFLDGDEVPDGRAFLRWWRTETTKTTEIPGAGVDADPTTVVAYKLANYWYFLSPHLRSEVHQDSVLLIQASRVTEHGLRDLMERDGLVAAAVTTSSSAASASKGETASVVVRRMQYGSVPGRPMFHHYSWVRSRRDLLQKVGGWGHSSDRPWKELLEHAWTLMDEYGEPLRRDFVHGHPLIEVDTKKNSRKL